MENMIGRKAESVNVYDMRDSKSTLKNLMQGMYLISFILNITEIFNLLVELNKKIIIHKSCTYR